jgi:hypothetical protein
VTFCLDFHRPGTAPGLGDKNKHSALLYRCQAAHITQVRAGCAYVYQVESQVLAWTLLRASLLLLFLLSSSAYVYALNVAGVWHGGPGAALAARRID